VARVVATVVLVARVVGLPALLVSVCVAALGRASGAASLVGATILYALLFGVAFGGLARLSSSVSPRHGRIVFVALVLGPEILRSVLGDVPALVTGFGELIDLLFGVGGAA
jgi:hypothetical protein